jgi:hypothetical protein
MVLAQAYVGTSVETQVDRQMLTMGDPFQARTRNKQAQARVGKQTDSSASQEVLLKAHRYSFATAVAACMQHTT